MTELFNTIPWEDAEHGDVVFTPEVLAEMAERLAAGDGQVLSFIVREPDRRISGVTEMALWEEHPEHAWQWLTAVHTSAQGNGIGRWIKAEMLLHLRETRPRVRWILTSNASSNAAMLKINTELGFETHKVVTTYQMPFAEFARAARGLHR
jgi:GNAT superfamily N-acetyltransferase